MDEVVGKISKAGHCAECGVKALVQANLEITNRSGPAYEKWKLGMHLANGWDGRPTTPYAGSNPQVGDRAYPPPGGVT